MRGWGDSDLVVQSALHNVTDVLTVKQYREQLLKMMRRQLPPLLTVAKVILFVFKRGLLDLLKKNYYSANI